MRLAYLTFLYTNDYRHNPIVPKHLSANMPTVPKQLIGNIDRIVLLNCPKQSRATVQDARATLYLNSLYVVLKTDYFLRGIVSATPLKLFQDVLTITRNLCNYKISPPKNDKIPISFVT